MLAFFLMYRIVTRLADVPMSCSRPTLFLRQIEAWETYYPKSEGFKEGSEFQNINEASRNIIEKKSNCYVHNCNFIKSTSCSIYFKQTSVSNGATLLVEFCSFFQIRNSGNGAAIYFFNQGHCAIALVCASKCWTTVMGQFAYVYVTSRSSNKNQIIDSSITLTYQPSSFDTLYIQNGDVIFRGVSVSNNVVCRMTSFYIYNAFSCSISFSSFSRNNATEYTCLSFSQKSHVIKSSNIIENSQNSDFRALVHSSGSLTQFKECCFLGNQLIKGKMFETDEDSSITCLNCTIGYDQQSTTGVGKVDLQNASSPFVIYYEFLSSFMCESGIDEWGGIKPILPSDQSKELLQTTFPCDHIYTLHIKRFRVLGYILLLCSWPSSYSYGVILI